MSYSFCVKGPSKTDAILDFDARIDKLSATGLLHAESRALALRHVREIVILLEDPYYTEDVVISTYGYLSESTDESGQRIVSVSCAITASLVPKR